MCYDLLLDANVRLLTGEAPRPREAAALADALLLRVSRACPPVAMDAREPLFFLSRRTGRAQPPKLLTGRLLHTRWIAETAYELETLRLLALFGHGREPVEYMLALTDKRMRLSGFHRFQPQAEQPAVALAALRFWSAHRPMDWALQDGIIEGLAKHMSADGTFPGVDVPPFYAWLALATAPSDAAVPVLRASLDRLRVLNGLPWPQESGQRLRRAIVGCALRRATEVEGGCVGA